MSFLEDATTLVEPFLVEHSTKLSSLIAEVCEIGRQLQSQADRIFGPQTEKGSVGEGVAPEPDSHIGRIVSRTKDLRSTVEYVREQVRRLESLG